MFSEYIVLQLDIRDKDVEMSDKAVKTEQERRLYRLAYVGDLQYDLYKNTLSVSREYAR